MQRPTSRQLVATDVSSAPTAALHGVSIAKPLGWDAGATSPAPHLLRGEAPAVAFLSRLPSILPRLFEAAALALGLALSLVAGRTLGVALAWEHEAVKASADLVLFFSIGFALLVVYSGASAARRMLRSFLADLRLVAAALTLAIAPAVIVASALGPQTEPSVLAGKLLINGLPALVILPLVRQLGGHLGNRSTERVLVVGSGEVASAVIRRLSLHRGVTLVGTVDDAPAEPALGGLEQLGEVCTRERIDRVVVAFSRTPSHLSVDQLRALDPHVSISVVPRMFELLNWTSGVEELDGLPLMHAARPQLSNGSRMAKRALDIAASTVGLLVLAPLVAVICLAVKIDSPGPILFWQQRTGRLGRPFNICKFRTMRASAESEREDLSAQSEVDGPIFKIRDDPRITRVGRFLRKTSLDEIPQLLNVVAGHMSLVGPRPFPVSEAAQITDWPVPRTHVRPGITGLWQISGRNDLSFRDLQYLDSLYVSSWSFWWDLRILLLTPSRVLRRKGAY